MQFSLHKLIMVVSLFSRTEFCLSEQFEIELKRLEDVFKIPSSKCDKKIDYCSEYNAFKKGNCRCYCGERNATFSFYKNSWTCLGNEAARRNLGCSKRTFFQNENSTNKLSFTTRESRNQLSLTKKGTCKVNKASSWYIGCHGNKKSFEITDEDFTINWNTGVNAYSLKLDLPDKNPLSGRVVNLGISCTIAGSLTEHSCLLFKMEGTTNCPVEGPITTKATMAIDTTKASSATIPRLSRNSSSTRVPPEVLASPSPAADHQAKDVTSSVGLIAAINVSVILVILVIGFCIYRWKYSRNQPHSSNAGGADERPLPNSRIQTVETDATYATLDYSDSGIYVSNYDVPGNSSNNAPVCVEQPVYNLMEVLDTDNSGGPHDYSTIEGHHNKGPISVEQSVYNLIEDFDKVLYEDNKNLEPECPAYHALEEPLPNSAKGMTCGAANNAQGPVYNVLEGHSPNTADEPVCDPLYTILEGSDQGKSETYSYAVV